MLPLVGVPETVRKGLRPYRDLFRRAEGFEYVSRYVTGLLVNPNKTLQGIYAAQVWSEKKPSRRAMHEAVFEAGWDAETPLGVVDIVLGVWFDPSKTVTRTVVLESGLVGDVERVSYQMDVDVAGTPSVIEQVAYYSQEQGRITQMRLVCSGFRPL